MSEVWRRWEGEVINGVFPLLRFLNDSDHSAVFLTESKSHKYAAIKIIPADRVPTETQLARWRRAKALFHPHLIRLIDAGHCQLGVAPSLFVVMEYADETLAQILPRRALTADEVREMLLPTLDVLAFLHRKNLVQGQLKPPNFLVVNDQLKLSSDTIRPAGGSSASTPGSSLYDPPEARDGRISTAGDIWGLGVTLVEALTQRLPEWPDEQPQTARLPTTLPATFVDVVQRCLSHDPDNRPTAADLEALFKRPSQAFAVSAPRPIVSEAQDGATAARKSPRQRFFVRAVAAVLIAAVLIILGVVWNGSRRQSAASRFQTSAQPAAAAPAAAAQTPQMSLSPAEVPAPSSSAEQPVPPLADASPAVLHEQIPDVPRSARDTIQGHVRVAVRVSVDASGNVRDETLENPGPSKYFARLATDAARKWRFAPADNQDSREWLLRFEFTHDGTTAHAAPRNQR